MAFDMVPAVFTGEPTALHGMPGQAVPTTKPFAGELPAGGKPQRAVVPLDPDPRYTGIVTRGGLPGETPGPEAKSQWTAIAGRAHTMPSPDLTRNVARRYGRLPSIANKDAFSR